MTGGTFDKEYDELTGALSFKDTHLPEMLRLGRCRVDVSVRTLMMIDSLEMTAADRALSSSSAGRRPSRACDHPRHRHDGRDRGGARGGARPLAGKTIVLTGAMIPYAFGSSDGLFNLGSALSFVQVAPAGRLPRDERPLLRWDRVQKEPRDRGI